MLARSLGDPSVPQRPGQGAGGARAVCLDAALRATHGRRGFRDVEFLPVTKEECLALTIGQAADLGLDDAQHLLAPGLVVGGFARAVARVGFDEIQRVGVLRIAGAGRDEGGQQRGPQPAHLLAPEVIVGRVLQDALEQRRQLAHRAVGIALDQPQHGVLDQVERGLLVAHRVERLLERTAFAGAEKIVEFLPCGHPGAAWAVATPLLLRQRESYQWGPHGRRRRRRGEAGAPARRARAGLTRIAAKQYSCPLTQERSRLSCPAPQGRIASGGGVRSCPTCTRPLVADMPAPNATNGLTRARPWRP